MSINYTAEDDMKRIQALDLARDSGKGDPTGIARDRELMRSFLTGPGKECEAFPSPDVVRLEAELKAARAEAAALRGAAQFALEILPALREDLDPREDDYMANVGLVMACVDRLNAAIAAKLEAK